MSRHRLWILLASCALIGLGAAVAAAQDTPPPTTTWRPSGGSLFGNTPQQTSGGEVGGRPTAPGAAGADSEESGGTELLAFELTFTGEVSFEAGYVERFEAAYAEAIAAAEGMRPLQGGELRRRMRDASVIMVGELDEDSAAQVAERVEAERWILAVIGAASGREYEIVVTRADLGDAEEARVRCRETSGRTVAAVETALRSALTQCLAAE
jgi:hypothetical protein